MSSRVASSAAAICSGARLGLGLSHKRPWLLGPNSEAVVLICSADCPNLLAAFFGPWTLYKEILQNVIALSWGQFLLAHRAFQHPVGHDSLRFHPNDLVARLAPRAGKIMLGITTHRLTLCKPNARNRNDTFGGCQIGDCHQSFAKKFIGNPTQIGALNAILPRLPETVRGLFAQGIGLGGWLRPRWIKPPSRGLFILAVRAD